MPISGLFSGVIGTRNSRDRLLALWWSISANRSALKMNSWASSVIIAGDTAQRVSTAAGCASPDTERMTAARGSATASIRWAISIVSCQLGVQLDLKFIVFSPGSRGILDTR